MSPPKVSLCMIVRDEAETLERCLDSVVGWVSEIVVVDTGSGDGTRGKAKACGAKLLHVGWEDDFATARNLALAQATGNWILVLDGDEWIESAPPLAEFAAKAESHPALFATILDHLDGGALRTFPQIRLFRNRSDHRFRDAFPEQIAPAVAARAGVRWIEPPPSELVIGHDGFRSERRNGNRSRRMVDMLRHAVLEREHEPSARYALAKERLRTRGLQAIPGTHVREALTHLDWLADHAGVLPKRFEADAARLRVTAMIAAGRYAEARVAVEPWRETGPVFEALYAEAGFEERAGDGAQASEFLDRFRGCFDQDGGRGLPFRQPSLTGACIRARAAEMCVRLGRLPEAEKLASEAAALPGGGAAPAVARGLIQRARKNRDGARDAFHEGTESNPHDPWAWLGLGEQALEAGDAPEAIEALARCSRIAPGWGRADEALTAALLIAERQDEIPAIFGSREEGNGASGQVALALAAVAADREPPATEPAPGFEEALSRVLRAVESAGKKGLLQKLAAGTRRRGRSPASA